MSPRRRASPALNEVRSSLGMPDQHDAAARAGWPASRRRRLRRFRRPRTRRRPGGRRARPPARPRAPRPARSAAVAPVCERLDGERHPGAGGARDLRRSAARSARSRRRRRSAPSRRWPRSSGVDGDAERLEHRAGDAVEGVGERVQRRGRPRQVPLQPAVAVPVAGEDDVRAQVAVAFEAARADAARERRVDGDAPPVERPALDDARELVAGHDRPREPRVPPMPPSSHQCRSEPQRPTASTRTRLSPAPGSGTGSSATRRSPMPCSRAAAPAVTSTSSSSVRGRRRRCMTSSPPRPKWSCRRV